MDKMSRQFHLFKCYVKCNFDYNFHIDSQLVSAAFVAFVGSLILKDIMHIINICLHLSYVIVVQFW